MKKNGESKDGQGKAGQFNKTSSISTQRGDSDIHLEYPEGAKATEGRKPGRAMTVGVARKESQDQHVCGDWRYFLQRIQGNMKDEYFYYSIFSIPETKMDKAEAIDQKIIEKYGCNMSKDQRHRNKKKGNANFQYFRFQSCGVIMATPGNVVDDCEPLINVNIKPMVLRVGTLEVVFKRSKVKIKNKEGRVIKTQTKYTLFLTDKCMEEKKREFNNLAKRGKCEEIIEHFNRLNGIPSYSGIVQNKVKLKKHLKHLKQIHSLVDLDLSKLRIKTYKEMYNNKPTQKD